MSKPFIYWLVGLGLAASIFLVQGSNWFGSSHLHTIMEVAATLTALMVGAMAFVRFRAKPDITLLIIAVGFIGTGLLDGYHALVTSSKFASYLPSELPSLIPWSWIASRFYLSMCLVLSLTVWIGKSRGVAVERIKEEHVYLFGLGFTLASFLFFVFVPLPRAYYPEYTVHRPEELLPAALLLGALIGYIKKGDWRRDVFEHWIVLSLIVGLVSQSVMMPFSDHLFDAQFDTAHLLKILSYLCVMTGLLANMYDIYQQSHQTTLTLAEANVALKLEALERGRAEQELKESEERFRDIAESASDWFWETDAASRFTFVSDRVEGITGFSPAWHYGKTRKELMGADVDPSIWLSHQAMLDEHLPFRDFVYPRTGEDGKVKWMRVSGNPIFSDDGVFLGYRGTATDFTNQREAEEQTKIAMLKAEEANRAKSDFLSSMSHELRTPLNSILGFGQVLSTDAESPLNEDQKDSVNQILRAGQHLLELINDVLDFSALDAGAMAISIEDIPLNEILRECLAGTNVLAAERGIKVAGEWNAGSNIRVRADATRLKQVVLNLLGNAVKYNREAGSICLECKPINGNMVRISIIDTGIGIEQENLPMIFDPFHRVDRMSNQTEGTGIGLTITKRLTEMMGGQMGVISEPGVGSTFWIDLPEAEPPANAGIDLFPFGDTRDDLQSQSSRTVLYVEDNPSNRRLMERIVGRRPDLELLSAHDAELGLKIARARLPDVVLMDISLPGMSGYQALEEMQADERLKHIPVLAVTANATVADREHGASMGFRNYLTKPLVIEEVLAAIDAASSGDG